MPALDLQTLLGIPALPKYLKQINIALEASLADADPLIREAALRHVLAPSKRLRPGLVLAIIQSMGMGKPLNKKAITACVAIELAHISSLIHDDIIDHADSRHGIPTINSQEGVDQAIIIGDYLLAEACAQAANVNAEAARVIARAITRICDGQSREVADQYNIDRDGEAMLTSIRGKTAELFAAACRVGGICAGASPQQLDTLSAYGEQFGMSFQLIDDVLDFISSDMLFGKPVGNDIAEGVYTMPVLLALHGSRQEEIREALLKKSRPTTAFTDVLVQEGAIAKTIEVAQQFATQASSTIATLEKHKDYDTMSLQKLPIAYATWSLQALIAERYVNLA
jgi:heptaprenyl diphosphate synthase